MSENTIKTNFCRQCKEYADRIEAQATEIIRLREALADTESAIAEYYRYWTGGETRGSYDGKPERAGLWKALYKVRAAMKGADNATGE